MCVLMCMCECSHTCGDQRTALGIVTLVLPTLLRDGALIGLELTNYTRLPGQCA